MRYVRVAVNIPTLSGVFDYHLPDALTNQVTRGCLVTVPFGNQTVQGVVTELLPAASVAVTKAVISLLDPLPALTPAQLTLAAQLAQATLSPLASIINLMLPTGLSQQADVLYSLHKNFIKSRDLNGFQVADSSQKAAKGVRERIVELLEARGPLRGRQIDRHIGGVDWRKSAQAMVRQGLLTSESVLPPPSVRPKFIRTAQLAVSPEEAEAAMESLGKTAATLSRRQAALRLLIREPQAINVTWVYAESGCNLADLEELAERELIILLENEFFRDPVQKAVQKTWEADKGDSLQLTPEQEAALREILAALNLADAIPFLLHGITGSGKTEIYLRAAAETIRQGKQAIILVPEIALTPQTIRRFAMRFPGRVGIIHSKLSEGERYDTWRRARSGQLSVIVGPRSALFTPLPNIGLIVADECHDHSYYQSDPPFYHAVEAAQQYAQIIGAACVLGSATPSISQRQLAERGALRLLELPQRVSASQLPPVQIVDMRDELHSGNREIFSRVLMEALAETLERGEQAILYLNRRGTATYIFCRNCGETLKCPHCDMPLTSHQEPGSAKTPDLICHQCGYTRKMPDKCPVCDSPHIRAFGLGSEKVESEVSRLFPNALPLRWDWDTTRQKDAHELILSHFAGGRANVLVGTQMLAKGLDLPNVTLVGIVLAEVGLNIPDPFARERVFQTLTQVAGRAGRSEKGGRVVLQTFQPEDDVIRAAAGHDYAAFYATELAHRRSLGYPPFYNLLRLEYRDADPVRAESEARQMAAQLKGWIASEGRTQTELSGPVPSPFPKVSDIYRWQIILRGPNPVTLLQGRIPPNWRVEVGPVSLL